MFATAVVNKFYALSLTSTSCLHKRQLKSYRHPSWCKSSVARFANRIRRLRDMMMSLPLTGLVSSTIVSCSYHLIHRSLGRVVLHISGLPQFFSNFRSSRCLSSPHRCWGAMLKLYNIGSRGFPTANPRIKNMTDACRGI